MKLHIGVDSQTGLTHSAVVTAANRHDKHPLPDLLHGQDRRVYDDSARQSEEADRREGAQSQGLHHQRTRHDGVVNDALKMKNRNKSRIRSRVEHVFGVVKRLWGFGKARNRGLAKNATRAFTAMSLATLPRTSYDLILQSTRTRMWRPCFCLTGLVGRRNRLLNFY